jgi:hypothetical protein
MSESYPALPRAEVVKAIEHAGPSRVPMMIHAWNGPDVFGDRAEQVRALQRKYPCDFHMVIPRMPQYWDDPATQDYIPGYSWMHVPPPPKPAAAVAHDANVAITDWAMLDDMLAAWPDPNIPQLLAGLKDGLAAADGRYTVAHWWFCFYERLWSLRGMENILCDFYEHPDKVHRLMDALCDFYCTVIARCGGELGVDGLYTTDDIGMQTGTMFGPAIFREFFLPRYKRLVDTAHRHHMHFWLHTCGNVLAFLEDLIGIGVDVIHPIQKYTMDEREVARRFGGRIAFWAGMDLQHILPRGSVDDVRREVRFLIDTYDRPDGGCMITAGNGITADVPVENLAAFYDEAYTYGLAHRRR